MFLKLCQYFFKGVHSIFGVEREAFSMMLKFLPLKKEDWIGKLQDYRRKLHRKSKKKKKNFPVFLLLCFEEECGDSGEGKIQ